MIDQQSLYAWKTMKVALAGEKFGVISPVLAPNTALASLTQ
jgi:hypothetical protein